MSKQTTHPHEALVRKIAEEMASSRKKNWNSLPEGKRNGHIANAVPAARIAVKYMAEEYQRGYMSNFPDTGEEDEKMWEDNCLYEMKERGLIPRAD